MSGSARTRHICQSALGLLLATVMLLPGRPLSHAQETAGETDIDIVVHSSDLTPATPGGTSPGVAGASSPLVLLPGTVSARFVQLRANDLTGRADDAIMVIVIRDDRGSASGWEIAVTYTLPAGVDDAVDLIEGQNGTIRRMLPDDGRLYDQIDRIRCGQTLGPLSPPVTLVNAAAGSGSGVFFQQIVVILPESDPAGEPGTLFVQIPFAP